MTVNSAGHMTIRQPRSFCERGGFDLIRTHKRGLTPAPEAEPQANDNPRFDEKAWRRKYMKKYMREWRRRAKAVKEGDG
jgi:hypothetical protein